MCCVYDEKGIEVNERVNEIRTQYDASLVDIQNFDMVSTGKGVCQFRNEGIREELKKEYDTFLPPEKCFAVALMETCIPDEFKSAYDLERNGLDRDWNGYYHKKYLVKVHDILEIVSLEDAYRVLKILK